MRVDLSRPLIVPISGGVELAVAAAVAGCGVIHLFENWLKPYLDSGALVLVLTDWWAGFTGPFLYFPSGKYLPGALRALVGCAMGGQEE